MPTNSNRLVFVSSVCRSLACGQRGIRGVLGHIFPTARAARNPAWGKSFGERWAAQNVARKIHRKSFPVEVGQPVANLFFLSAVYFFKCGWRRGPPPLPSHAQLQHLHRHSRAECFPRPFTATLFSNFLATIFTTHLSFLTIVGCNASCSASLKRSSACN